MSEWLECKYWARDILLGCCKQPISLDSLKKSFEKMVFRALVEDDLYERSKFNMVCDHFDELVKQLVEDGYLIETKSISYKRNK